MESQPKFWQIKDANLMCFLFFNWLAIFGGKNLSRFLKTYQRRIWKILDKNILDKKIHQYRRRLIVRLLGYEQ